MLDDVVLPLNSQQVLHHQWIWKRYTLNSESNASSIQGKRRPFASLLTLPRKPLDAISKALAMALKLKLLLLLKNGDEMRGLPLTFSLMLHVLDIFHCLILLPNKFEWKCKIVWWFFLNSHSISHKWLLLGIPALLPWCVLTCVTCWTYKHRTSCICVWKRIRTSYHSVPITYYVWCSKFIFIKFPNSCGPVQFLEKSSFKLMVRSDLTKSNL